PGTETVNLDLQFEPIDSLSTSPHFKPLQTSAAVDASRDCLDALGATLVDVDQLQAPRPGLLAPLPTCDMGAVEYTGAIFADGLETPPAP
ncbi:MAG TPA: choice-of-anchor Q domain-containing protein, partial [Xanthomonadaceae bacterium]|nr:choice-of-anchor Q domain-containing protein [Xanthomonadaceae bacterium]